MISSMPNTTVLLFILTICAITIPSEAGHSAKQSSFVNGFCCFWAPDLNSMCSKCHSFGQKTNWCSKKEDNCKSCGGTWCVSASYNHDHVIIASTGSSSPPADASSPRQKSAPNGFGDDDSGSSVDNDDIDDNDDDDRPDSQPPSKTSTGNPFKGHKLYVNPTFKRNIQKTIKSLPPGIVKKNLVKMSHIASAYWLDVKEKVLPADDKSTYTAAGILKDAASKPTPPLVTFIVYNLPNRDCNAKASNGEVCCGGKLVAGNCNYLDAASAGTCGNGMDEYKHNYINNLAVSVKNYCRKVPMVLVIEPDSLPNLVTNIDEPKCGSTATKTAYRIGIKYAIKKLAAACPEATQYLDAAHGGWLGWPDNLKKFVAEVKNLRISKYIRGFSLNVANYQPLGIMCPSIGFCISGKNKEHRCCQDPCGLAMEYNRGHSELNYAAALSDAMKKGIPGFSPKFIIDTGRNAKSPRASCAHWCNARGAGVGIRPTTDTAVPELVDAYHWLKTPGESDGCTRVLPDGRNCPRYDASCASEDSIGSKPGEPRCPEAGYWFDFQIKMLAKNAAM